MNSRKDNVKIMNIYADMLTKLDEALDNGIAYAPKYGPPCPMSIIQKRYCSQVNGGCQSCKKKRVEKITSGSIAEGICYIGDIIEIRSIGGEDEQAN